MNRRLVLGILVALLVVAGAAVVAGYAYSAGVAQGLLQEGRLTVPEGAPYAYPYAGPFHYGPWMGAWGFGPWGFGFGLARCLFPLLAILLLFALVRGTFRHGWRRHWGGPYPGSGTGAPPMFEEWHRRAHGETPPPSEERPS